MAENIKPAAATPVVPAPAMPQKQAAPAPAPEAAKPAVETKTA